MDRSVERAFLLKISEQAHQIGDPTMAHLMSPVTLMNYIRIADEIRDRTAGGRILDWGCGYGQMSFLLRNRGFDVVAYDVGRALHDRRLPITDGIPAVLGGDPISLPFIERSFDAVASIGVLEHVPDPDGSLEEIRRILGPGGRLFLYNLPQRLSYKEFLIRRLGLGYTHERRYTSADAARLLVGHGFRVERSARAGFLPHTGTGLGARLRRAYGRMWRSVLAIDRFLSRTPLLNRLAESLEIEAVRL